MGDRLEKQCRESQVFIVSNDYIFRKKISITLRSGHQTPQEFDSVNEFLSQATSGNLPGVVLVDADMPSFSEDKLKSLKAIIHGKKLVLCTSTNSSDLVHLSLRYDVNGIFSKSDEAGLMAASINFILLGGTYISRALISNLIDGHPSVLPMSGIRHQPGKNLSNPIPLDAERAVIEKLPGVSMLTAREKEVLSRLLCGEANKEIAKEFGVSPGTIKNYVTNILRATNMASRSKLIVHMHSIHTAIALNSSGFNGMH
ncbi:DNA-binding response regulator, NarL/FixJ family, contains REC and HTH domains [Noviherbaspirillum humi]|uniref:DNA-binding response regulator, NarL/FixJ family, contains REC and HTH domains n=1 Tax=Noviherbaspirillum humi TaxID=1688639 RepID=A0A239M3F8_9BURK|nr:response regulator transcription factor [Noviherbaspirillum humi]SNT37165.1 DNA-binding response regulator, NarL/FixJ family, contains REC and HTH domains [Noviherbaspirillum humi]